MSLALIVWLAGIAVVDSINPSLFIGQFVLLATAKPVPRVISYIAGIVFIYILGGIVVLFGLREALMLAVSQIRPEIGAIIKIVIGMALAGFGFWYKAAPLALQQDKKPKSLSLGAAFAFGIVVMFNELTTALPYFVAIERISAAQLGLFPAIVLLVFYNVIFSLPLFVFLALFVRFRERFTVQIASITRWIAIWSPRIIKYSSLAFAVYLLFSGLLYFLETDYASSVSMSSRLWMLAQSSHL